MRQFLQNIDEGERTTGSMSSSRAADRLLPAKRGRLGVNSGVDGGDKLENFARVAIIDQLHCGSTAKARKRLGLVPGKSRFGGLEPRPYSCQYLFRRQRTLLHHYNMQEIHCDRKLHERFEV